MVTVAAVDGYALGGGCELALSCDLIVAAESAVFGLPEVGVGLVPGGGGTQLLPRRIGWNRAADLILTGRQVAAVEAYRLGLADRLVAPGSARDAALRLATEIAARSPRALRSAKAAMRRGFDVDLPSGLAEEDRAWHRVAFSADRREGIAAFTERRAPRWSDRVEPGR
jgi:enoyl-CoA hydratase/carnithine racemase